MSTKTDPIRNQTLLTEEEYIAYYQFAQAIKINCSRKVKKDHAKYVPWKLVKEKIKPIRSGANKAQKKQYIRESAEAYHALRTDLLTKLFPDTKIERASSTEIHRLAGLLVAYNGVELEDEGDGTVRIFQHLSDLNFESN